MLPSNRLRNIVEYISLAASTTKHIADSVNSPVLRSAAVLSLETMDCVRVSTSLPYLDSICLGFDHPLPQTVKTNAEACIHIMEYVHQILCAVIGLDVIGSADTERSSALLHEIQNFIERVDPSSSAVILTANNVGYFTESTPW